MMSMRSPRYFSLAGFLLLILALPALAQETTPELRLTVGRQSCALALAADDAATPEATPEATAQADDLPTLTLGDECDNVAAGLYVPANGTLWLGLTRTDAPGMWLTLSAVEGDEHPPTLDGRGRYFGCANPTRGEQVCRVQVDVDEATYRVEIPMLVRAAFRAPSVAATVPLLATAAPAEQPQPGTSGDSGGNGNSGSNPPAPTMQPPPACPPEGCDGEYKPAPCPVYGCGGSQ